MSTEKRPRKNQRLRAPLIDPLVGTEPADSPEREQREPWQIAYDEAETLEDFIRVREMIVDLKRRGLFKPSTVAAKNNLPDESPRWDGPILAKTIGGRIGRRVRRVVRGPGGPRGPIGRHRGGIDMPFDPDADDADADGWIQEGTRWARRANPRRGDRQGLPTFAKRGPKKGGSGGTGGGPPKLPELDDSDKPLFEEFRNSLIKLIKENATEQEWEDFRQLVKDFKDADSGDLNDAQAQRAFEARTAHYNNLLKNVDNKLKKNDDDEFRSLKNMKAPVEERKKAVTESMAARQRRLALAIEKNDESAIERHKTHIDQLEKLANELNKKIRNQQIAEDRDQQRLRNEPMAELSVDDLAKLDMKSVYGENIATLTEIAKKYGGDIRDLESMKNALLRQAKMKNLTIKFEEDLKSMNADDNAKFGSMYALSLAVLMDNFERNANLEGGTYTLKGTDLGGRVGALVGQNLDMSQTVAINRNFMDEQFLNSKIQSNANTSSRGNGASVSGALMAVGKAQGLSENELNQFYVASFLIHEMGHLNHNEAMKRDRFPGMTSNEIEAEIERLTENALPERKQEVALAMLWAMIDGIDPRIPKIDLDQWQRRSDTPAGRLSLALFGLLILEMEKGGSSQYYNKLAQDIIHPRFNPDSNAGKQKLAQLSELLGGIDPGMPLEDRAAELLQLTYDAWRAEGSAQKFVLEQEKEDFTWDGVDKPEERQLMRKAMHRLSSYSRHFYGRTKNRTNELDNAEFIAETFALSRIAPSLVPGELWQRISGWMLEPR